MAALPEWALVQAPAAAPAIATGREVEPTFELLDRVAAAGEPRPPPPRVAAASDPRPPPPPVSPAVESPRRSLSSTDRWHSAGQGVARVHAKSEPAPQKPRTGHATATSDHHRLAGLELDALPVRPCEEMLSIEPRRLLLQTYEAELQDLDSQLLRWRHALDTEQEGFLLPSEHKAKSARKKAREVLEQSKDRWWAHRDRPDSQERRFAEMLYKRAREVERHAHDIERRTLRGRPPAAASSSKNSSKGSSPGRPQHFQHGGRAAEEADGYGSDDGYGAGMGHLEDAGGELELDDIIEVCVSGPSHLLQSCTHAGIDTFVDDLRLQFGPLFKLSMPAKRLMDMGIDPNVARYVAFVYPCEQVNPEINTYLRKRDVEKHIRPVTETLHALLVFGGFCYFDATGLPIRYLSFVDEGHKTCLYFEDSVEVPDTLDLALHRRLFRTQRFRRTTIASLKERGAECFAWLRPNELLDMQLTRADESSIPAELDAELMPFGAFAYTTATRSDQYGRKAVFMKLIRDRKPRRGPLLTEAAKDLGLLMGGGDEDELEKREALRANLTKVVIDYLKHKKWRHLASRLDEADQAVADAVGLWRARQLHYMIHNIDDPEEVVKIIKGLFEKIEQSIKETRKAERDQRNKEQQAKEHDEEQAKEVVGKFRKSESIAEVDTASGAAPALDEADDEPYHLVDEHIYELVNETDADGTTPIFKAVERNNLPLVELLIKYGADLRAVRNKRKETIRLLSTTVMEEKFEEVNRPMLLAARRGYYAIVQRLCYECWSYTDVDTSTAAGHALDVAFEHALRQRKFDAANDLLLASFLRNDGQGRIAIEETQLKTLKYAVAIVEGVSTRLNRGGDDELREVVKLKETKTRVQHTAAAMLEKLMSPRAVDAVLSLAWDEILSRESPRQREIAGLPPMTRELGCSLLRQAVRYDCGELLSCPAVRGFLARTWRGALVNQMVTGVQRRQGVIKQIRNSQLIGLWLVALLLVLPINLLLLPLVAAWPPLDRYIVEALEGWDRQHGEVRALQMRWSQAYLLRDPMVKFYLHQASNITLAILLTSLQLPIAENIVHVRLSEQNRDPSNIHHWWVCYIWLIAVVCSELTAPLRSVDERGGTLLMCGPLWRADLMNFVELPFSIVALIGMSLTQETQEKEDVDPALPRSLIALALMPLWLATCLRIAALNESIGPLVRMTQYMVRDVLKWLGILFILVLAFAAARYKVILGLDLAAYSVASGCKSFFTDNRDIGLVALHLFEIAIGAQPDEDFNCMEADLQGREASHQEQWVLKLSGRLLTILWMIVAVALTMNMLIAMMAKSFDLVWTAHLAHVRMVFAQSTLLWHVQPSAPPPLSLLSLPYQLLMRLSPLLWRRCASMLDFGDGTYQKMGGGGGRRDDGRGGGGGGNGSASGAAEERFVMRTFHKEDVERYEREIHNYVALESSHALDDDANTEQNEFRVEMRRRIADIEKLAKRLDDKMSEARDTKKKKREQEDEKAEEEKAQRPSGVPPLNTNAASPASFGAGYGDAYSPRTSHRLDAGRAADAPSTASATAHRVADATVVQTLPPARAADEKQAHFSV